MKSLEIQGSPQDQDPYTKDAGHTPIPRSKDAFTLSSAYDSDSPLTSPSLRHPAPELIFKPPNERSMSYLPSSEELSSDLKEVGGMDPDPALTGPLGLVNHGPEDEQFLSTLNSKLEELKKLPRESPQPDFHDNIHSNRTLDPPQAVPGLRLKQSMNFGSAFGAAKCGKNF